MFLGLGVGVTVVRWPDKVAQRGVQATQQILDALLDGAGPDNGRVKNTSQVFVVDALPNRSGLVRFTVFCQ